MKRRKISISALSDEALLSNQQMAACVGGNDYDYTSDSSCFFNCMEYIGKECYNYSYNCDVYGHAYVQGYEEYEGTNNWDHYLRGIDFYDADGNFNSNIIGLIGAFFGSASTEYVAGSDAHSLFADGDNDGVMGFFLTGDNVAHSVIITGYDAQTETYTYFDPSKERQDDNQTIKASDLLGVIDCKQ